MLTHAGARRAVDEDPQQPGAKRRAPGEAVDPAQHAHPGVLRRPPRRSPGWRRTSRARRSIAGVVARDERRRTPAPRPRAIAPTARRPRRSRPALAAAARQAEADTAMRSDQPHAHAAERIRGECRTVHAVHSPRCRLRRPRGRRNLQGVGSAQPATMPSPPTARQGPQPSRSRRVRPSARRRTRRRLLLHRSARTGSCLVGGAVASTVPPSVCVSPSSVSSCRRGSIQNVLSEPLPAFDV